MKKLLSIIVGASTILFVALSSVTYAGHIAKSRFGGTNCASYVAPSSADASSPSLTQSLKAQLLAVLSSLLKSSSPIAGVVVPDRPAIDPNPPSKVPPDNPPPGGPVYDVYVKCDGGWEDTE